jgi:hypothetical protein
VAAIGDQTRYRYPQRSGVLSGEASHAETQKEPPWPLCVSVSLREITLFQSNMSQAAPRSCLL